MDVCKGEMPLTRTHEAVFLSAVAHLQLLLADNGLRLSQGVVVQVRDGTSFNQIVNVLRCSGAVVITMPKQTVQRYPNDRLVVMPFRRTCRDATLEDFLMRQDITPAVIVGGILPDSLRFYGNVVCFDGFTDTAEDIESALNEYKQFVEFTHARPDKICDWFRQFQTSLQYTWLKDNSEIRIALEAVIFAYWGFLRESHNEQDTNRRISELQSRIEKLCEFADSGEDEIDVISIVQECLSEYVDCHKICVLSTSQSKSRFKTVREAESVILYDAEHYFVSENLLEKACMPVLSAVSFLKLKEHLLAAECLECNNTKVQNYTVKKLLLGANGEAIRPRYLKLNRLLLDDSDQLTLMERGDNNVSGDNCR